MARLDDLAAGGIQAAPQRQRLVKDEGFAARGPGASARPARWRASGVTHKLASRQRRPATAERTQSSRDPKMTWAPMLAGAYQAHLAESVMVGSGKGEGPVPGSCTCRPAAPRRRPAAVPPCRRPPPADSTSRAVETSSSTPSAGPSSRAATRSSDGDAWGSPARRRRSACRAPLSQRWSAASRASRSSSRVMTPTPRLAPTQCRLQRRGLGRGADHVKHGHRAGRRGCRSHRLEPVLGWLAAGR